MKAIAYNSRNRSVMIALTLLALLVLGAVGCGRRSRAGIQVIPVSNRHVLELNADDVVQIMRRAGFSDSQVLEHGPALRQGLAESGSVQIKINNTVEVVFAVKGDSVYISSRLRGLFIYNIHTGWVSGG